MPYRKTRKQKGGAGFFSMVSKPTPSPSPPPYESYLSSVNRLYTFLYSKVKPSIPGYIPLQPGQRQLTVEQKELFRSLLETYKLRNANGRNTFRDEDFVEEVLGLESVADLTREIQAAEAPGTPIQDVIFNRPAIAQSYAGSWGRFIAVIF